MSEELNCSEGARMLIERMQTHPKDFKHDGRFARITDHILGKLPVGFSDLSDRDDTALSAAYDKYILEPNLTEYVVDEIFNGEKRREEEQKAYAQTSSTYTANLARGMVGTKNQLAANTLSGFHDPRLMWPAGAPSQIPAQGVMWNGSVPDPTQGQIEYLDNNGKERTLWQRINQQLNQLKKSATA